MIKNGRYVFGKECERVAELLQLVGNKWSVLVVVLLGLGPRRFNDLKRSIPGISQRMLTRTLRELEQDGLVDRTVTSTIPPYVSYGLTTLGASLNDPVRALCDWALRHVTAIESARTTFADRYGLTGFELKPTPTTSVAPEIDNTRLIGTSARARR